MKNTEQTLFQQYFHSELNKASQPRIGISQQPQLQMKGNSSSFNQPQTEKKTTSTKAVHQA